jgi:membrane carboxypeptidase/penicillin-binding protein
MWQDLRPPNPLYRRAWFLSALFLSAGAILAASVWMLVEKGRWEAKAREFDYKKLEEMESASVIYDRVGGILGRIFIQNREQVSLADLSPALLTAVVAAEDARFYQHHGVDYQGIARAVVRNWQKRRAAQGASTITQQLARNTFAKQLPAADKTFSRKLLEMFVAQEIERRCDKRTILELYLNRVFFGSGFYGAESASRGYFGKPAKDLNLSEAATLAGLLKSPSNLSPWRNRQACVEQRNYVLQRAFELKLISSEEYQETLAQDLYVKNRRPTHQESYPADMVAQQMERLVGRDSAMSDGYRIYTTIDPALQKKTEQALRDRLSEVEKHEGYQHPTFASYDALYRVHTKGPEGELPNLAAPEYLQGAVVVLDNKTGAILSLMGGRDCQHSEFNRSTAPVPAGTVFTPFVYAAGFENGLFPGTIVQDTQMDNRQVMIGGTTGLVPEWGVERADNRYEGPMSAREALVKSKNAATVRFGNQVKLDQVLGLAKEAGFERPLRRYPSTFLGSSEVTLMDMTLATTLFPNGGVRPLKTFLISRVEDQEGRVVFESRPGTKRVLKPTTAYQLHSCLADILERGPADKTFTELGLKRAPLGGKSGTAYNFTDAWFVGYSSEVTCGVWVGFDKNHTSIYRGAFGSEVALPVWTDVMGATFAGYKPGEFSRPPGLSACEVCSASGLLATEKCFETAENKSTGEKIRRRTAFTELATAEQAPKDLCDVHGGAPRALPKPSSAGKEWPRAAVAMDVSKRESVQMKAPSVVGAPDPFGTAQSGVPGGATRGGAEAGGEPGSTLGGAPRKATETALENQPEVRRAEPVRPVDAIQGQDSPVKLPPPPPIKF